MDPLEAARRWARTWAEAWPRLDPDPVADLYADDASIHTHPFRDPLQGPDGIRDYLRWSFAVERDVRVWYEEPIVQGADAVVEYWATLVSDGAPATISGVAMLRFDADGHVVTQRDTWVAQAGHTPPPPRSRATAPRVGTLGRSNGGG